MCGKITKMYIVRKYQFQRTGDFWSEEWDVNAFIMVSAFKNGKEIKQA